MKPLPLACLSVFLLLPLASCEKQRVADAPASPDSADSGSSPDSADRKTVVRAPVIISDDPSVALRDALVRYTDAAGSGQWEAMLDMTYAARFEHTPKQELLNYLKGTEANGIRLRTASTRINEISTPTVSGKEQFIRAETEADQTMELIRPQLRTPEYLDRTQAQLVAACGPDSVRFEEATNTFHFTSTQTLVGIAPEGSNDWGFLPLDSFTAEKGLVPMDILAKWVAEKVPAKSREVKPAGAVD